MRRLSFLGDCKLIYAHRGIYRDSDQGLSFNGCLFISNLKFKYKDNHVKAIGRKKLK